MGPGAVAVDGPLLVAAGVSVAAGVVSFASPCILPLVPGYLAFVGGLTGADAAATGRGRWTGVLGAVLFVLGFAAVFTVLGGAFGALGRSLAEHRQVVALVGGALVLVMGLVLLGLRPAVVEQDRRAFGLIRRGGLAAAFPLGVVFGAGWSPCIGPTLAGILTLSAAGTGASPGRGAALAFLYALGLGVPFVIVALALDRASGALGVVRRHARLLEQVGGASLVLIGALLLTGLWDRVLLAIGPWVGGFTPPL